MDELNRPASDHRTFLCQAVQASALPVIAALLRRGVETTLSSEFRAHQRAPQLNVAELPPSPEVLRVFEEADAERMGERLAERVPASRSQERPRVQL